MAGRCEKQTFHIAILELVSNCHSSFYRHGNVLYMKGSFFTCQMICIGDIIVWSEWNILTVFPFFVALFSLLLLFFSFSACTFSFTCYIYD